MYEHNIDEPFIAKFLGKEVSSEGKTGYDLEEHYRTVCGFWKDNTYDAMSYEAKICDIYPDHGAILGGDGPGRYRHVTISTDIHGRKYLKFSSGHISRILMRSAR